MSGLLLGCKISFRKNKQTKKLEQCSKGGSMTTRWARGGSSQAKSQEKRKYTLVDSYYFYIVESVYAQHCLHSRYVDARNRACNLLRPVCVIDLSHSLCFSLQCNLWLKTAFHTFAYYCSVLIKWLTEKVF